LSWSGVPRNSFYYKRGDGIRGCKPSEMTITQEGELVDNTLVVKEVEIILQQEFCCYGYKNVLDELKDKGYIINHKKIYRLMKVHNLLFNCTVQKDKGGKTTATPLHGHQIHPYPWSPA
jgi:hypothetical protein